MKLLENRMVQLVVGGAAAMGSFVLAAKVLHSPESQAGAIALGWLILGWLGLSRPGQVK